MTLNQNSSISETVQFCILVAVLFIAYLCVAFPLAVVPVFTTANLGLSNVLAGWAVGASFISTILTRAIGGQHTDVNGPKSTTIKGLVWYVLGGSVCLMAGFEANEPMFAYSILILGRLLVGIGESYAGVGIVSWGVSLLGASRTGKVLAIIGAVLYGSLAIGGPLGLMVFKYFGFSVTMLICAILPFLSLLIILPLTKIEPVQQTGERHSVIEVIQRIWRHGLVICMQGIGFAGIGSFFALYFITQGWDYAGLGLTAFGGGFVLTRILFGHLPDKFGGLSVAFYSLLVEVIGQACIWQASSPALALFGAFMTGLGCSMIYPSMGREVILIMPVNVRATALGMFALFQDVSYCLTGPLSGALADHSGYKSVFLVGTIAAVLGVFIVASLLKQSRKHVALS